jgi:GNAT superfamily N-acetyltransferase
VMPQEYRKERFVLSNSRSRLQIDIIHGFLARSHWAANRKRETIVKSIEHSLCYGIYEDQRQIAFARLVTDYCTYAYLCDVFVDESYRGRGLSKWMMECIMINPDLAELRRFTLATKDAHGLYERFGFKPLTGEEQRRFMSILKEGI